MKIRWLNALTVSLLITLVSLYLYSLNLTFFQLLELKAYDFKVFLRGTRPVSDRVVIVAIDESSLKREGRWPWPRTRLAKLVDRLSQSGAAVIGLDLLFPEKDIYVPFDEIKSELVKLDLTGMNSKKLVSWLEQVGDSDAKFANAIRRSERTVLAYFVYTTAEQAAEGSAAMMGPKEFELLGFSQYSMVQSSDHSITPDFLRSIYAVGLSLPSLMNAANTAPVTFPLCRSTMGSSAGCPWCRFIRKQYFPRSVCNCCVRRQNSVPSSGSSRIGSGRSGWGISEFPFRSMGIFW